MNEDKPVDVGYVASTTKYKKVTHNTYRDRILAKKIIYAYFRVIKQNILNGYAHSLPNDKGKIWIASDVMKVNNNLPVTLVEYEMNMGNIEYYRFKTSNDFKRIMSNHLKTGSQYRSR